MSAGLVSDPRFEEHDTGAGHPESPKRLASIHAALRASGLDARFRAVEPESADDALLTSVHDPDHIRVVERACAGGGLLDADTTVCPESARIARLAAGSLAALCRRVARGELERGLALVRPPGHHAERNRAMGFCLFNNVAVAAADLLRRDGIERVVVVDWDVHHGNGTQHIFEERADVFYASIHQSPLYPGTGGRSERGSGAGLGTTLNCPLPPGSGDAAFLGALNDEILPAAERFDPQFVLVSAGFDAHHADPLANLEVTTAAFAEATRALLGLARRHAAGRLVSVLEGGYDVDALAESVAAHADAILTGAGQT